MIFHSMRRKPTPRPAGLPGVHLVPIPCEKDGGQMYLTRLPCFMRRAGWKTVARCLRCGHLQGIKKGGKKNALPE